MAFGLFAPRITAEISTLDFSLNSPISIVRFQKYVLALADSSSGVQLQFLGIRFNIS